MILSSRYVEDTFHKSVLRPVSGKKDEVRGDQSDLSASAVFTKSFSLKYSIWQVPNKARYSKILE